MATVIISAVFKGIVAGIVAYGVGRLMAPDLKDTYGPRLSDMSVQTSTYGAAIQKLYGTVRIAGNLIWSTDINEYSTKKTIGGKGGGGYKSYTYTYYVSFAIGLCEGPIVGIRRIWMNGKLYSDKRYGSADEILTRASINTLTAIPEWETNTIYLGNETQLPDATIQLYKTVADTPAYRGLSYLVFNNLTLTNYSNRIPQVTVEVIKAGTPTPVSLIIDSPASPNMRNMTMTKDGNLITCSNTIIYVHRGMGETIMYQFPQPRGSGSHGCLAIDRKGNLISCWDNNTLYIHSGLSSTIKYTRTLPIAPASMCFTTDGRLILYGYTYWEVCDYEKIWDGFITDVILQRLPVDTDGAYGVAVDSSNNLWSAHWTPSHKIKKHIGLTNSIDSEFNTIAAGNPAGLDIYRNDLIEGSWTANAVYIHEGLTSAIRSVDTWAADTQSLDDVVGDICDHVGLTDYDVSDLNTDTVYGYVIDRLMDIRKQLEPLMMVHQFDAAEIDDKIVFVKRGGAGQATIAEDELAAHEYGQEMPSPLITQRAQETDMPREVIVEYMSKVLDYQVSSQRSIFVRTPSRQIVEQRLPMVLTDDMAKQTAEIIHVVSWLERNIYKFATTIKYAYLAPADVAVVDGRKMRIDKMSIKQPGLLEFEAYGEQTSGYISDSAGSIPDFTEDDITPAGMTMGHFLDIPILQDGDNNAGFYLAAHGFDTNWSGAVLFKSGDGGMTWIQVDSIVDASVAGNTTDTLDDGPVNIWDHDNTVNIQLYDEDNMSLSSATEAQVLNGANVAVIGAHGRWEIIQFQTATLEGDGTYTLSGLLRGRKGTDWATGQHQTGDTFVLLTTNIIRIDLNADDIGLELNYKLVTFDSLISIIAPEIFTNNAVSLEPYSPAHIKGSRDGSDNLTITWIRRNRLAGEWRDSIDVPLSEDSESYEVDIMDGAAVKRTLTGSSESVIYTAAQQTTDWGAPQSSVEVNIYQLSADVGRGYARNETI